MPPRPAKLSHAPAEPLTIEAFLTRCDAEASTIAAYRDELERFERRVGAPLGSAPTRALERLKDELRPTRGYRTRARLIRQFYRAAGQDDRAAIFRPKKSDARSSRISPDEILTLPEVNDMLRAAKSLRDRALIAVLWESGARISEVLHLDVRDVRKFASRENGGREFVTVFFHRVKVKGEEHSALLIEGGDHVRAWLAAYKPEDESWPLFPSGRGDHARMTRNGPERLIVKIAARAGVAKHVYPHLFRHSRTTHLLRIGVPEIQVAKLLGWRSTRMLQRYAHLVDRDAYAALLRAHGLEPPEPVRRENLASAEGELQPVVPIVRAPGPAAVDALTELRDLAAADPRVRQALDLLLESVRQPPPA